jgi:arabinogalactan oligomer/maltooligosaccharide transport system permease protein
MSAKRDVWPHVVLVPVTIAALYPVMWVLKMALSPGQGFDSSAWPFPSHVTLSNFSDFLGDHDLAGHWLFGRFLFNSVSVALATTLVGLTLATSAAWAFSRFRFPGRQAGLTAFLLTQIFPGVVMLIPLYILLSAAHLTNSLLGLTLVYSTTSVPFCTWMLKGYFDTFPREMEEQAAIDGASRFVVFRKIALPLARPMLAVTALFSFMTAWNEFVLAATLLNDQVMFTLPVALQRYVGQYQTDWGRFAAGAILTSAPVMALFYALQKHLVGGLTSGSVKG